MTVQTATDSEFLSRVVGTFSDFNDSHPGVIPRLMKLTADPNTAPDELARLLSHDPGLTATFLRVANSAYYGRCNPVSSLKEAVGVLGFTLLRSIVVAVNMASLFSDKHAAGIKQSLWDHSLAVALGCRRTAVQINLALAEEAFLAGLMHDLAKIFLLQQFSTEYEPVLRQEIADATQQVSLETGLLSITHAELGAMMLERWNFPPSIIDAVRSHHAPDDQPAAGDVAVGGKGLSQLAHIICFADKLAHSLGYGPRESYKPEWENDPSVAFLKLTPESVSEISAKLIEEYTEESELLTQR